MSDFKNLDWQQLLSHISHFTTSQEAQLQVENLKPFKDKDLAKKSSEQIFDAISVVESGQRPFMESLDLCFSWSLRLEKKSVLGKLELKDIRFFCVEAYSLKEVLLQNKNNWIQEYGQKILKTEELLSAIDQIVTLDGNIKSDASENLYGLFKEKNSLASEVQKSLDQIVKDHDMKNILQDRYVTTREGRWVLPIKSGQQHSFKGILHTSSQSKQTVFMEPEKVIQLNNRLREIEFSIEKEIQKLLRELSDYIFTHLESLKEAKDIMLKFDVLLAKSQFSNRIESRPFQFSNDLIKLEELKNPILVFNENKTVSNSVELDTKNHTLILSGPNAGGKTVLLKSIGLVAQMARCGLPICAKRNSKIPFFKNILVSIGDSQSIEENLSTFAAHLKILNKATEYHGLENLLLIDEICSSTDPEEGAALARSFINTYSQNNVFCAVTSHFGNLKTDWPSDSGIINGSLDFDTKTGPTYQFILGVPGQSLAIQTAKQVGVSQSIIQKAINYLSPEQKKYNKSLFDIDGLKNQLNKVRNEYTEKIRLADAKKIKYENLLKTFEQEKSQILSQSVKAAEKKIEKLIELSKAGNIFSKHSRLQKIKSELPEIINPKSSKTEETKINSVDEFSKRFPPGSKIYVPSLGRDAVIQSQINSRGELEVLSNSMRLFIEWTQLKPPHNIDNPTHQILRKKNITVSHSPIKEKKQIDLRGMNTEDAILEITDHLNEALLKGQDRIKIIHGHGTEALKKAVRQYLSRSIYIKKWESGGAYNGGDGVTWAEIKDEPKK